MRSGCPLVSPMNPTVVSMSRSVIASLYDDAPTSVEKVRPVTLNQPRSRGHSLRVSGALSGTSGTSLFAWE